MPGDGTAAVGLTSCNLVELTATIFAAQKSLDHMRKSNPAVAFLEQLAKPELIEKTE